MRARSKFTTPPERETSFRVGSSSTVFMGKPTAVPSFAARL